MKTSCKFMGTCEAPFCPLSLKNHGVWLSSDAVCHRQFMDSTLLVRNQKLLKKHSVSGYFSIEMLTCSRLSVRNGINPDVDSMDSMKLYRKRERNWLASLERPEGVKTADFGNQKTLDIYFYSRGKKTHKSAKMEVKA